MPRQIGRENMHPTYTRTFFSHTLQNSRKKCKIAKKSKIEKNRIKTNPYLQQSFECKIAHSVRHATIEHEPRPDSWSAHNGKTFEKTRKMIAHLSPLSICNLARPGLAHLQHARYI